MNIREPLVRDYMTLQPATVESKKSIQAARDMMSRFGIRHLPVTTEGFVSGILSEREVNLAAGIESIDPSQLLVADVCNERPYIVDPETPIREVARVMAERHYGSAVVMKNGDLVGIFTTVDACRALHTIVDDVLVYLNANTRQNYRYASQGVAIGGSRYE